MISNNRKLNIFLEEIYDMVNKASKSDDFNNIFYKLKMYPNKIKYDDKVPSIISMISICSFIILLSIYSFTNLLNKDDTFVFSALTIMFIISIVSIAIISFRSSLISDISDSIFNKDIYFDNNLKSLKIENGCLLWNSMKEEFPDLNRGDENQEIYNLTKGRYKDLDYKLHSFYYENVSYYPTTTIVNKVPVVTINRSASSYKRHGLICDFPFEGAISIFNYGSINLPVSFSSKDSDFNSQFNVTSSTELVAARLLVDEVIHSLINLNKYFNNLNIYINNNKICVTYDNEIIFLNNRKNGIDSPTLFEEEIKEHRNLERLNVLLDAILKLKEYKDNRNILKRN